MQFYIVLVLVVLASGVVILFFANNEAHKHMRIVERELNEFRSRTLYEESCTVARFRLLEEENRLLKEYLNIELQDQPAKKQFKVKTKSKG